MHTRLALATPLALASVTLLASACGGKGASPGIANLGTTGTTATTPAGNGGAPSSNSSGGSGAHLQIQMNVKNGAQFSACMRKNGVPNFPDPTSSGNISIGPGSGINPDSPSFKTAQKTCRKLLPNGGQPTPAQVAKAQQAALEYSKCMRSHGVTNFPDPTFSNGGGIGIKIGSKGGNLNPDNPTFKAAQQACQGRLGFPKGGGATTSSGGK